jgi:membrane-associated phospholipid phosphatase
VRWLPKDIVARARPVIPKSDFLIASDKVYSFPSGHAAIVSAGGAKACWDDSFRKEEND